MRQQQFPRFLARLREGREVERTYGWDRAEWQRVTSGEELARGKEVRFFPKPNYPLTTDDNDAHDLTSGVLSARKDDRVWFSKDAVGWHYGVGTGTGILAIADLLETARGSDPDDRAGS